MTRVQKLAIAGLAGTLWGGLLAASARPEAQTRAATQRRPAVIGYVFAQDATLDPALIDADKLTHINYAFANIRDGKVVEGFAHDADNYRLLTGLRRSHPPLKILVSVGGWTWSGGFSDAALTPDSRRRFVDSAVDFVRAHDLDGFDVDWEYPGLPGYGNTHRPEDRQTFTALMAELRAALDKEGAAHGRAYLLTFAAGASSSFIEHTELSKVQSSVDFVNLMTYDFRVAEVDGVAGHHANLFDAPADAKQRSADRAVREFLAAGVPAGKLVMGVPFYGRGWGEVSPQSNGLYQSGKPLAPRMDLTYGALATGVIGRDGFVRFWDETAQAPYLWNAARRVFITYEDPESLRLKTRYIREHGLAGAMFWQYGEDPTGALLGALDAGLRQDAIAR
jgi:chitinase